MKKILLLTFSFLLALMPLVAEEVVKVSDVDIPVSSSDVHFARIKNYFPGDTVVISNFDTNVSVEVVVISAIEEYTDISLIISKNTADALEFIQGASYSVKIGKRAQTDKRVRGIAEVSCSSSVEELTKLVKDKESLKKEIAQQKEIVVEAEEEQASESESEKEISESFDEIPAGEEIVESVPETVEEKILETASVEEDITEPEIEDLPAEVSEIIIEDVPEVEDVAEVIEPEETVEIIEESPVIEPSEEESVAVVEEAYDSESFVPETVETLPSETEEEPESDYSEKFSVEEIAVIPQEIEKVEEEAEVSDITEVEALPEIKEKQLVAEAVMAENLEDIPLSPITEEVTKIQEPEYYDAIILPEPEEEKIVIPVVVPVEEPEPVEVEEQVKTEVAVIKVETPVVEVPAVEEEPEVKDSPVESPADEVISVAILESAPEVEAPAPIVEEKTTETKVEEKKTTTVEKTEVPETNTKKFEKYISKAENLKSGKYYIQIAAYKNEENIMDIVNKYGKKYPLTFVELSDNRGYKILVGPLGVDEYKVVLERFKSYGFKDAFVKKQ